MDAPTLVTLIESGVAAVASVFAVARTWNAVSKKDLEPLEQHAKKTADGLEAVGSDIASMNLRLDEQNMRAMVDSSAQRVSITVAGHVLRSQPLDVTLTLVLDDVILTQIELFNQIDMKSGEINCMRKDPHTYVATIHPITYEPWYQTGVPDQIDYRKHTLKLRAHMIIVDQRVHRDFIVNLRIGQPQNTDRSMTHQFFVTIDGSS